jgi:hypothetical protein
VFHAYIGMQNGGRRSISRFLIVIIHAGWSIYEASFNSDEAFGLSRVAIDPRPPASRTPSCRKDPYLSSLSSRWSSSRHGRWSSSSCLQALLYSRRMSYFVQHWFVYSLHGLQM